MSPPRNVEHTLDETGSRLALLAFEAHRSRVGAISAARSGGRNEGQVTCDGHEETIHALRATIKTHEATIEAREATIRARDAAIRDLLSSTSWKATAPLRAVSRTFRWYRRIFRRAPRHLYRQGKERFSRVTSSMRFALAESPTRVQAKRSTRPIEISNSVSEIIRQSRRRHVLGESENIQRKPDRKASR